MTRPEALVALNMVADIGSVRLQKLLQYFDNPQDIFQGPPDNLVNISGISRDAAYRVCSLNKSNLDKEISSAAELGLKIITLEDKQYPENLKNIPGAPIVLYIKGDLLEKDGIGLAIVGSRRASFYGLSHAGRLAEELSACGLTIVSGMARGIDTYAHRGALKRKGRTIAVLGSGFRNIYPPENQDLSEEIAANGAVISEFCLDTRPLRQNFPRRNRIISGLSLGVAVIEAARNSGALITADFALEQGREVFALPGAVNSRTSFGTNELIKQGAKLISCAEDIIEELNLRPNALPVRQDSQEESPDSRLDTKLSLLKQCLAEEPVTIDQIAEKTAMDIPLIYDILLKLQIKRLVRKIPGNQFVKG